MVHWCNSNFLQLNKSKTKELRIDFRRKGTEEINVLKIDGTPIEKVKEYKYLGVLIDKRLNFDKHARNVNSKMNKRMWLVKKLKRTGIDQRLVRQAFQAFVEPIARYGYTALNHQMSAKNKRIWFRVIQQATKMKMAMNEKLLMSLESAENKFVEKVIATMKHPLFTVFQQANTQSTRNQRRQKMIFCRTSRFKNSLVPQHLLRQSRTL